MPSSEQAWDRERKMQGRMSEIRPTIRKQKSRRIERETEYVCVYEGSDGRKKKGEEQGERDERWRERKKEI